jgi:L-alanine-DL-glutamate epimerase-like enolase superfamily enzyme
MRIERVEAWRESIELSRPYEIAYKSTEAVELVFVRLVAADGSFGLGAASPSEQVTGESVTACAEALAPEALAWLAGRDARQLGGLCRELSRTHADLPAARAALDMALHDLFARRLGLPLVDLLGRCHDALPTSITIGIKGVDETAEECREYLGRGFTHLKVKLGRSFEEDEARLWRLRELAGPHVRIRVDANQGYSVDETVRLGELADRLDLELIEQPLPAAAIDAMRALPDPLKRIVAADESLLDERDALRLATAPAACGIFNVKLMKCGGISVALGMARIAAAAGLELMWGCNDESAISIAAALHAAYACPATRYIDLDGSFDLSRDAARGGFAVENGRLRLVGAPGLGVTLVVDAPPPG